MTAAVQGVKPEILKRAVANELVRRSFPEFLKHCRILSDDPQKPEEIPFVLRDYQLERALSWEQHTSEVIAKPRQIGFSWMIAAYMSWRAMYHGWHVAYYSVDSDTGDAEIDSRVLFIVDRLPSWMPKKYRKRKSVVTFVESTGFIHPFPGTQVGGVSYTLQLVVADEAALHPYGADNYAFYRPTLGGKGQYIAATSSDGAGQFGFFWDLWTKSVAGKTGYNAVFIPWHVHPGRDGQWYAEERDKFPGSDRMFRAQNPETIDDFFSNDSGLVYGAEFSRERNVKKPDWTWEEADIRVVAIDPGGEAPTAMLPVTYRHTGTKMQFHVFGEFYKRGPISFMDIGDYLQTVNSVAPITKSVCDPSNTLAVPTLRGMGWHASKAINDKGAGIGQVAHLLRTGILTIDPSCTDLLYEIQTYWWVQKRDMTAGSNNAVMTRTPSNHHADALDCLRYAVLEIIKLTNHTLTDREVKMVWR